MTQTPEEAQALEKQLCCICNGTGIQPGENPMCPEHYLSEVINKKKEEEPKLGINLMFDEESHMYVISFIEGQKAIFQVKMSTTAFEKLSNDMIRTVKNYNLYQAQQYQEKMKNGQKEDLSGEALNLGGGLPDSPCADNIREDKPEQPESNNG